MQKIPYFSGRTKLNHFNSTMSVFMGLGFFMWDARAPLGVRVPAGCALKWHGRGAVHSGLWGHR